MLGGEVVSDGVRASAREMLAVRRTASEGLGRRPTPKARKGEANAKGESERAKGESG
jgi:hypothetical protein